MFRRAVAASATGYTDISLVSSSVAASCVKIGDVQCWKALRARSDAASSDPGDGVFDSHLANFAIKMHICAKDKALDVAHAGFLLIEETHFASSSSCFMASAAMSTVSAPPRANDALAALA